MKKKILYIVLILVISYIAYNVIFLIRAHKVEIGVNKEYLYLFKDEVQSKIDSRIGGSRMSNSGIYNVYHYDEKFTVIIWQINNIKKNLLNYVDYYGPLKLSKTDIKRGEVFSPDNPTPVTVRFKYHFHKGINVKPNYKSTIDTTFRSETYKGFLGDFDKILLEDKSGEDMIVMEFKPPYQNLLFLTHQSEKDFFLLIVNSEEEVKMEMLKIFSFVD